MRNSILILCVLLMNKAFAQQERQVSHFMYDMISVNPGSAGSSNQISANLIGRQQWTGIDGAPNELILNLSSPFKLFHKNHGVGLSILRDRLGFNSDNTLQLSYAYQFTVGKGRLGLGITGMADNQRMSDVQWVSGNSPIQDPDSDPAIPRGDQNEWAVDFAAGLFYRTEELYMGVSVTHLLEDEFVYQSTLPNADARFKPVRHYYFTAGYNLPLTNPLFELQPAVFLQSDLRGTRIDLNTTLLYNKKIWAGVTYRVGAAVVGMIGMQILNGVKVGYSYDFDTSALSRFSNGSHEVFVGYNFTLGIDKIPQRYKSIRYL